MCIFSYFTLVVGLQTSIPLIHFVTSLNQWVFYTSVDLLLSLRLIRYLPHTVLHTLLSRSLWSSSVSLAFYLSSNIHFSSVGVFIYILELCLTWPAVTPPKLLQLCLAWPTVTPQHYLSCDAMGAKSNPSHTHLPLHQLIACIFIFSTKWP